MGMMDGFRKVIGLQAADGEDPIAVRDRMKASKEPSDVFAVALADRLVGYNQDPLARALPEIAQTGGKWSRDPDSRWVDIARVGRDMAEKMTGTPVAGLDAGMSKAVTDASLADAARSYGGRGPVIRHVAEAREDMGRRVGSVLADGADAERLAVQNSRFMAHRRHMGLEGRLETETAEHVRVPTEINRERHVQWLLDGNRAFLAMARNGMLPDEQVVGYARDTATYNAPFQPKGGTLDRTASAAATTMEARRAIVAGGVQTSIDSLDAEAGARVSPPFRPVEMTVIPTSRQMEAARESEFKDMADAEWMQPGGRRMTNRMEGRLVGEKAGYELRQAIAGRAREGDAWQSRTETMLPRSFLEKSSAADLQAARVGRIDAIGDEALRMTMGEVVRDSRQLFDNRQHQYGHHAKHAEDVAIKTGAGMDVAQKESQRSVQPNPATRAAFAAAGRGQAAM